MVTELVGPDVPRSRHDGTRFDAVRRELDWTLRDTSEDVGGRARRPGARRVAATLGMGRLERAAARLEEWFVAGGAA
jgi:hypothetical protein